MTHPKRQQGIGGLSDEKEQAACSPEERSCGLAPLLHLASTHTWVGRLNTNGVRCSCEIERVRSCVVPYLPHAVHPAQLRHVVLTQVQRVH